MLLLSSTRLLSGVPALVVVATEQVRADIALRGADLSVLLMFKRWGGITVSSPARRRLRLVGVNLGVGAIFKWTKKELDVLSQCGIIEFDIFDDEIQMLFLRKKCARTT